MFLPKLFVLIVFSCFVSNNLSGQYAIGTSPDAVFAQQTKMQTLYNIKNQDVRLQTAT